MRDRTDEYQQKSAYIIWSAVKKDSSGRSQQAVWHTKLKGNIMIEELSIEAMKKIIKLIEEDNPRKCEAKDVEHFRKNIFISLNKIPSNSKYGHHRQIQVHRVSDFIIILLF